MKRKLILLLAATMATCGTVGILSACKDKSGPEPEPPKSEVYNPGDTVLTEREGDFYYDQYGNLVYEKTAGKKISVKYLVSETAYVTLSGEKITEMVIDGYSGNVQRLSVADIEDNIVVDNVRASVVGVADGAFYGCESLNEVDLTKTNLSLGFTIGTSAFENCSELRSVKLPENTYTTSGAIGSYAFRNDVSLTTVELGTKLDTIGNSAFENCLALKSVSIPENITVIRSSTFKNCDALATLNIAAGANLKSIQDEAFYGTALSTLNLSRLGSLRYIGDRSFAGSGLTDVTLPDTVTYIGTQSFYNCKQLATLNVPFLGTTVAAPARINITGNENIDINASAAAFRNIYGISGNDERELSVTVKTASAIPAWTFANCEYITSLSIDKFAAEGTYKIYGADGVSFTRLDLVEEFDGFNTAVVKEIGDGAFAYCANLAEVSVPADVEKIGDGSFGLCEALTEFTLPATVTELGASAFALCGLLEKVVLSPVLEVLGEGAFYGCEKLAMPSTAVVSDTAVALSDEASTVAGLPETLKTIGDSAFYNCELITSVTIPASVTYVGNGAFEGCKVTSLTIGRLNGLEAVYDEDDEEEITGYKYISLGNPKSWFDEETVKSLIKNVTVSSLYTLGTNAFYGFEAMTVANLTFNGYNKDLFDEDVKGHFERPYNLPASASIGSLAFFNCYALATVNLKDSDGIITAVGDSAFANCRSLTSFNIPATVTRIGSQAFSCCYKLSGFTVPATVKTLGTGILTDCYSVSSLTIEKYDWTAKTSETSSTTSYYTLGNITASLFSTSHGNSEYSVSNFMYTNRNNGYYLPNALATVTVKGVTVLADSMFYGWSKVRTMNITFSGTLMTSNMTYTASIGDNAFYGCTAASLTFVNAGNVKSIGYAAFENCNGMNNNVLAGFNQLYTISDRAFASCKSISTVTLPSTLTSLGTGAFYGCPNIAVLNIGNYNSLRINNGTQYLASIFGAFGEAENVDGKTVAKYAMAVSAGYYVPLALKTVTVKGLSRLGSLDGYFFNGMNTLESVLFDFAVSDDFIIINNNGSRDPFTGCTSLKKIFIPDNIENVYLYNVWGNNAELGDATVYTYSYSQPVSYGNYWQNSYAPQIWTYPGQNYTFEYGFELEDEDGQTSTSAIYYAEKELTESELPVLERDGKVLIGWYDNSSFNGYPVEFPYYSSNSSLRTLYAKWIDEYDEFKVLSNVKFEGSGTSYIYSTNKSGNSSYELEIWAEGTLTCGISLDHTYVGTFTVTVTRKTGASSTVAKIDNKRNNTGSEVNTGNTYYNTTSRVNISVDIKPGDVIRFSFVRNDYDAQACSVIISELKVGDIDVTVPEKPDVPDIEEKEPVLDIVDDIEGVELTEEEFMKVLADFFGDEVKNFTADAYLANGTSFFAEYDLENAHVKAVVTGTDVGTLTYYYDISEDPCTVYFQLPVQGFENLWLYVVDTDGQYWGQASSSAQAPVETQIEYSECNYNEETGTYWMYSEITTDNQALPNAEGIIAVTVDEDGNEYVTIGVFVQGILIQSVRYSKPNETTVDFPEFDPANPPMSVEQFQQMMEQM